MLKELLSDVFPVIEKVAPVLAGYLAGPYSGIASAVFDLLVKSFGVEKHDIPGLVKNIIEDPDSHAKLMKIQGDIPNYLKVVKDIFRSPDKVEVNIKLEWNN